MVMVLYNDFLYFYDFTDFQSCKLVGIYYSYVGVGCMIDGGVTLG